MRQSLQTNPQDPQALYQLGQAYTTLGRYHDAIETYKVLVGLEPDHARGHYALAMAYRTMGDLGAAVEEYAILKTLNVDLAEKLFG